jgi:hypothetical protein
MVELELPFRRGAVLVNAAGQSRGFNHHGNTVICQTFRVKNFGKSLAATLAESLAANCTLVDGIGLYWTHSTEEFDSTHP